MSNGVIPTRWFGDFALDIAPVSNARGCHRRSEVFEGVDEILRKREPHRGIGRDMFFVLKEVGATVWGSAKDLGQFVEPVLPQRDQLLQ